MQQPASIGLRSSKTNAPPSKPAVANPFCPTTALDKTPGKAHASTIPARCPMIARTALTWECQNDPGYVGRNKRKRGKQGCHEEERGRINPGVLTSEWMSDSRNFGFLVNREVVGTRRISCKDLPSARPDVDEVGCDPLSARINNPASLKQRGVDRRIARDRAQSRSTRPSQSAETIADVRRSPCQGACWALISILINLSNARPVQSPIPFRGVEGRSSPSDCSALYSLWHEALAL